MSVLDNQFKIMAEAAKLALELPTLGLELTSHYNLASRKYIHDALKKHTPNGHGEPVVMLPGFMAPGFSLAPLGGVLKQNGYAVYDWGLLLPNLGPKRTDYNKIAQRIRTIARHHDEPVWLIGQSFGGTESVKLIGDLMEEGVIAGAIILGSPAHKSALDPTQRALNRLIRGTFDVLNRPKDPKVMAFMEDMSILMHQGLPGVPITAIHSDLDMVVGNQVAQVSLVGRRKENVKVYSSHIGMGFNPFVKLVILDRLAQNPDTFQPFDPGQYHAFFKIFYPNGGGVLTQTHSPEFDKVPLRVTEHEAILAAE